jgi:hypothetical protein
MNVMGLPDRHGQWIMVFVYPIKARSHRSRLRAPRPEHKNFKPALQAEGIEMLTLSYFVTDSLWQEIVVEGSVE